MGSHLLSLWLTWACVVQSSGMLSHVDRYEVMRPRRLTERHRRSPRDKQLYPDTVRYQLTVEGRNHTIHLEKNGNLFGRGYTETHYLEDGKRVTTQRSKDHCYYHGHIEGVTDSSVSVGICSGISGFFRSRRQVYIIEPLGHTEDGDHAVYRQEYLKISGSSTCGSTSNTTTTVVYNQDLVPQLAGLSSSRVRRTTLTSGPQRFVELVIVVDSTEYKRYGTKTESRVFEAVNHVDKLYRALNIRIVLVGLETWTKEDYIVVHNLSNTTLDNFIRWRKTNLLNRMHHDNAQFVTGVHFEGKTVGLANKYAMCTQDSGGVNQDHHDSPIGLASTIAHEMGHNFGLSHDSSNCMCGPSYSSGNCIMGENLRTGGHNFPEFFSDCSQEQLAIFLERAQPTCLHRPSLDRAINGGSHCGNALVDPGEECDCGTAEECNNPCCDASTCRLTDGAQCADGECCENCQFKGAEHVCRKTASECDLTEYCTGVSKDCPEDSFEMNGKLCFNHEQGYCYNGQCPTHQYQCWRLFGQGARVGPDVCLDLKRQGVEGANCGGTKPRFISCTTPNLKCGSIFCEGGGECITGRRTVFTIKGVIKCHGPVDDNKNRRLDMVSNGTKCDLNKVCLDNACVDVSIYGRMKDCAKMCNNNGVCNHKRECHCNPGWAPPYCDILYADLPQGRSGIIAGVCAAVSVLLVVVLVVVGLTCCKKENMENCILKRKVHSSSVMLNPMFQEGRVKERPQISQPTFMASTASHASAPLVVSVVPSRAAPPPPQTLSSLPSTSHSEPERPRPPAKPLPPLHKTQAAKLSPPAVPPVKPSPPPALKPKPCAPPVPPLKPQIQTHLKGIMFTVETR
ncbi:zinc metalloproteinase-disintegrin-like 2d isoform X2 [Thalassophryne amazonica]|uniref:zinc metalloproteinase-disintegrin-like 2d isoform X2 n=1 Tax=Thalassophryne amazonica TaxID=390379 RepID=UPI001470BED9|nr:zinc metalloproteinase-disintegrin-like 2d isoform X2 [Thalassophryne amazonica]